MGKPGAEKRHESELVLGEHPSAGEADIDLIDFSGTDKSVPFQNGGLG